jgi:hypothetical protein
MHPIRIAVFLLVIMIPMRGWAQRPLLNMPDHDDKLYYFGITFGANYSVYKINYTSSFAQTDSFKRIQPLWSPGFNLGLMGNLRLSRFVDFRFVPSLAFCEKRLNFQYRSTCTCLFSSNSRATVSRISGSMHCWGASWTMTSLQTRAQKDQTSF